MTRFHVFTDAVRPGLHIWRDSKVGSFLNLDLKQAGPSEGGWTVFEADLDPANTSPIRYMLFEWNQEELVNFENEALIRTLERENGKFPADVWLFKNSGEWTLQDPAAVKFQKVRVHLVTAERYHDGMLYLWHNAEQGRRFPADGHTASGPYWDLDLTGISQSFFNFKFMNPASPEAWEGIAANRTWTSANGGEIWVKSEAREISVTEPQKKDAIFHFRQDSSLPSPQMHLWQDSSDFKQDLIATPDPANPGWLIFIFPIYTDLEYGGRFFWKDGTGRDEWEHPDVHRYFYMADVPDFWMVEGDSAVLMLKPKLDVEVTIQVLERTPDRRLDGNLYAHVWIDRSRTPLHERLPVDGNGKVNFKTYGALTTSIKFHTDTAWESVDRHALYPGDGAAHPLAFATLDRFQLLWNPPPVPLYQNPGFEFRRPGVWEENGFLHFVLHADVVARVRLWGSWMPPGAPLVDLLCTLDRTFWWARIAVSQVQQGLTAGDYHGAEYHYIIDNDHQVQDPAAAWVVSSSYDANSRLSRSSKHEWTAQNWQRPGWDHLIVYQIHPAQFTPRNLDLEPLRRLAWEVENPDGYLRQLGITALLLMPVHEFPNDWSWGYNPAFYYAVESSYGGPDALKYLVDACHRNGIAVFLDLVFNHSGMDNPLWQLSRQAFFDGETAWGAMVNYDHPQCRYFFAKCVEYLVEEFRIDGIRLDHTQTILHGDQWVFNLVKVRGSGGGWEFLKALKSAALDKGGSNCLITAEHMPNEWDVSKNGGPLDSQWHDNFHDSLEETFRTDNELGKLADAYKITHTQAEDWFNSTNYGESHDEVGNEDDRLARVSGFGRGLRGAKVHAAAVLLSRGIPMFFMGAESAEWRQFRQVSASDRDKELPITTYLADAELSKVRYWWRVLCDLHDNSNFKGPSPLDVRFAQERMVGFTRGLNADYYVLLNFGSGLGDISLGKLNLPDGNYRELWNSTWDEFRNSSEGEELRSNGGRDARLNRGGSLRLPAFGVVILERA